MESALIRFSEKKNIVFVTLGAKDSVIVTSWSENRVHCLLLVTSQRLSRNVYPLSQKILLSSDNNKSE